MSAMKLPNAQAAHDYFTNKMAFTTGPVELNSMLKQMDNINVVDVRLAEDFAKGHIPGAVSLPKGHWDDLAVLDKNKINVLYCYSHVCHLAAKAAVELSAKGYSVMEMDGGFHAWQANGLEIEA